VLALSVLDQITRFAVSPQCRIEDLFLGLGVEDQLRLHGLESALVGFGTLRFFNFCSNFSTLS
jgi:hypothetical protein